MTFHPNPNGAFPLDQAFSEPKLYLRQYRKLGCGLNIVSIYEIFQGQSLGKSSVSVSGTSLSSMFLPQRNAARVWPIMGPLSASWTLPHALLVEIPSFPGPGSWAASLGGSPVCSRPSPTELLHYTKSCNGAVKWLVANVWILLSGGVTTGQVDLHPIYLPRPKYRPLTALCHLHPKYSYGCNKFQG